MTVLMASVLGQQVLTKDYKRISIRIAFHPQEDRFEVSNPAIRRDSAWIPDISKVFDDDASLFELTSRYVSDNPHTSHNTISRVLERLRMILNNHVGVIDIAEDLDIDTVTEIFIRVNSAGAELSQADFAMSKIAVSEAYGGNTLRKAIDYFCRLAVSPEFLNNIQKNDKEFAESEFLPAMQWLHRVNDDLYNPNYTDMLRVAFTSEFGRGKLQDLVALLSGRNFETRQFEEETAKDSFEKLKRGVFSFMRQTNFNSITMILRSTGFISKRLLFGQNAVNFAYILYLRGKAEGVPQAELERIVRRWYVMSVLRGRYTGSPETAIDFDIRQIESRGIKDYADTVLESELPDSYWVGMLPQLMDTSSSISPYFRAYQAAQVKLGDKGFLSRDITVRDLLLNACDVHHVYPQRVLKNQGLQRAKYDQIANYVLAQSEINIAIGAKDPKQYFGELAEQVRGGKQRYGGITEEHELRRNLRVHCLPESLIDGDIPSYDEFLEERRKLMALKIKRWFELL